ncbi:hypothetical protein [Actinoplanes sp. NPDC049118]|uniref:hypothetical protein n=1 Tax=Actinoplanes sp. NPDC049118 TaxID=3155769 RepID=UPI0033C5033B
MTEQRRLDVTRLRDVLFGLTYGEIAVAVAASPVDGGSPVDAVRAGLSLLGYAEVATRNAASLRLVKAMHSGLDRRSRRAARATHALMWGGASGFGRAHSTAERFWRQYDPRLSHGGSVAVAA